MDDLGRVIVSEIVSLEGCFTLLDVQRVDGSELVQLRYAVRSPTDRARAAARLLH